MHEAVALFDVVVGGGGLGAAALEVGRLHHLDVDSRAPGQVAGRRSDGEAPREAEHDGPDLGAEAVEAQEALGVSMAGADSAGEADDLVQAGQGDGEVVGQEVRQVLDAAFSYERRDEDEGVGSVVRGPPVWAAGASSEVC